MKVKRNTLLLLACLVWSAAGFNILRIGLLAYPPYLTVLNLCLSVVVFAVFQKFIFGKLVNKHSHHGNHDERRNRSAHKRHRARSLYRRILHRSWCFSAAGWAAVWSKLH